MSGPWPAIFSTCAVSIWLGSIASVAPNFAAMARRFSALSLTITCRAPRKFAHSITARAHRPRADHQNGASARHLRHVDRVQSHRQRFDQRAFAKRNRFRQAMPAPRADLHIFRISAGALPPARCRCLCRKPRPRQNSRKGCVRRSGYRESPPAYRPVSTDASQHFRLRSPRRKIHGPSPIPPAAASSKRVRSCAGSEPQIPQFFTFRIRSFGPVFGSSIIATASGLDISWKRAGAHGVSFPAFLTAWPSMASLRADKKRETG